MTPRTLAIGDIHGCVRALGQLLQEVQPQPKDVVVSLGDYIDRGPDSRGAIGRLLELRRHCVLIPILGNHDLMMLKARTDYSEFDQWLLSGGQDTMRSYGVEPSWGLLTSAVPWNHWQFLEGCEPYYQTLTHFFVHANAYPDLPLREQPDQMLYWDKIEPEYSTPHSNGKIMVCGHTTQRSGKPLNLGHAVCIDTWVYGRGWLTCLDVGSGEYWQAREDGQTRTGRLD
jgi:serine/threonine protein phosphatase 1